MPSSDARFLTIASHFVVDYVFLSRLILNSGCRLDNDYFDKCFSVNDGFSIMLPVNFNVCYCFESEDWRLR